MNKQDLPTNERDWTADQTVEAVREQSRQFTQQEADYQQDQGVETASCGLCFFWQGGGQCQVVGGEINQAGLSDLYINKELQDAAIGQQGEDEMSKGDNDKRETKAFSVGECKVVDEAQGIVEHLVAVMGNVDQGDDIIHQGAFTKTITERGRKVKVVDSHNYNSAMDAVGVPLHLWEVSRDDLSQEVLSEFPTATGGLMARTQFLMDTDKGAGIFKRIKAGAIDQYSIGYDALDADVSKVMVDGVDRTVRNLRTIKLYEYSPVVFAMNEATATVSAKTEDAGDDVSVDDELDGDDKQLGVDTPPDDSKAGRMLSAANAGRISSALVTLMDVLERAGIDIPGFDTSAAHEDDEGKARYVLVFDGLMAREDIAQINKRFNEWLDSDEKGYVIPGGAQVVRLGKNVSYNYTVNDNSSADNLKEFAELLAAQDVTQSPYAPLLPSRDVFVRFKELVAGGMDRPGAYLEAVLEQAELAIKETPAPDNQAADNNEHSQAGPLQQDAPTSKNGNNVLNDIQLLQAELSLMEV